ncbi:MAG: GNAT family N-acetyltransferase [Defluviitaleaceae bacterium]|nr:GNAT family N-acetyltransferase [Defluviitaleaceae bacterium]
MNTTIRIAVPSDAPAMAEVIMRSWEAAYENILLPEYIYEKNNTRVELYKRVITDENSSSYVILQDGEIAGTMKLDEATDDDLSKEYCEMHYIYLHPRYFRQGIGTFAVAFAVNKARELGKTYISVWVISENINSVGFYEKNGFVADGTIKTQERGKPVEIMRMIRNI